MEKQEIIERLEEIHKRLCMNTKEWNEYTGEDAKYVERCLHDIGFIQAQLELILGKGGAG